MRRGLDQQGNLQSLFSSIKDLLVRQETNCCDTIHGLIDEYQKELVDYGQRLNNVARFRAVHMHLSHSSPLYDAFVDQFNIYRSIPNHHDVLFYLKFVDSVRASYDDVHRLEEVFKIERMSMVYFVLLKNACIVRHKDKALIIELYEEFQQKGTAREVADFISVVFDCYAEYSKSAEMVDLLRIMRTKYGVKPVSSQVSLSIESCIHNMDLDRALECFKEQYKYIKGEALVTVYESLLQAFLSEKSTRKAVELFSFQAEHGEALNNQLDVLMAQLYEDSDLLSEALSLPCFQKHSYSAESVMNLWNLGKHRDAIDIIGIGTLDPKELESIIEYIVNYYMESNDFESIFTFKEQLSSVEAKTLVNDIVSRENEDVLKSIELLDSECGIYDQEISVNIVHALTDVLMYKYQHSKDWKMIDSTLHKMETFLNLEGNDRSYDFNLKVLLENDMLDEALVLIEKMNEKDIHGNNETLLVLVKKLCECENLEKCTEFLTSSKVYNHFDSRLYKDVFYKLLKAAKTKDIQNLIHDAKNRFGDEPSKDLKQLSTEMFMQLLGE